MGCTSLPSASATSQTKVCRIPGVVGKASPNPPRSTLGGRHTPRHRAPLARFLGPLPISRPGPAFRMRLAPLHAHIDHRPGVPVPTHPPQRNIPMTKVESNYESQSPPGGSRFFPAAVARSPAPPLLPGAFTWRRIRSRADGWAHVLDRPMGWLAGITTSNGGARRIVYGCWSTALWHRRAPRESWIRGQASCLRQLARSNQRMEARDE